MSGYMRFALLDMDRKVLFHNLDDASLWLLDKIDGNDELLQEYNWDSFYVSMAILPITYFLNN